MYRKTYQKNATEEAQRNVMNTENVVSVAHCQQQPFYPHLHLHFITCPAVDVSFRNLHVWVDSGRADTWETDPKAPALEQDLYLGVTAKLFAPDVHWCEAEGDEKILCKRILE